MDRRGFLTTTFAGGLAVTGGACAGVRTGETSEVPLADDELEAKLQRLDTTLERMNHKHTTRWFHEQRQAAGAALPTEADRERLTHEGELMRASLRSALLLSSVAELPEANRSDPRVVARVEQIAGEADYAVLGTLAKLRSLDASQLAALDREFAGASPGMDVAERIDELSDKLGVPASRRLHLRRMAKHLDWKLEREPFSAVVGEVVGQVGRAVEAAVRSLGIEAAGSPALASAGPGLVGWDLNWVERTREVVRFYAPAAPAAPIGEPSAAPVATPQPQSARPPTYSQADQTAWVNEQQRYNEQREAEARAAERAKLEKEKRAGTIMAGTSAGLLVLGGVAVGVGGPLIPATAAIIAVSLGGVGITIGMILLIIGLVLVIKANRELAE